MNNKIIPRDELIQITEKLKQGGKSIVAAGGCFDILHAGHVQYLEEAKKHGDILIVLLNSDSSVKAYKGDERPIVPENERAIVLAGLGCVDYVCLFSENTPCKIISEFQPDIFIKGSDYLGKDIPEIKIVAEYGGVIEYINLFNGCSSTNIIEKIKSLKKS